MVFVNILFYNFYSTAPCGSRSTGSEGTVLSPNYPKNYSVDHNCVYSIAVPKEFGK
jgi:CUB/sushi domain-containing protein